MSDQAVFDSFNPCLQAYDYEFNQIQQPDHQIEPIVNTSSNIYGNPEYHIDNARQTLESFGSQSKKDSLGYSSSLNVVQEIISPVSSQQWELVKGQVEILRQQIAQKTEFYTALKNKFIETQHQWQQQKKGLLAEISLIKTQKIHQNSREQRDLNHSSEVISIQKSEIKRLQQQILLKQTAWGQQKTALVNQLVALRNEINQITLIHRKQQQLIQHIQRQNQQISHMARDVHEGRKRQQAHLININRLSTEVQRLSLVHQKTNAMEQQLHRLNLQLGRWYQKGDKVQGQTNFGDIAAEENLKFLQKRIYILESSNYNLSQQIKRNRQIITSQSKLQENVSQLKIQIVKQQIQKQNAFKQVQLLKQQLQEQKNKKQRRQKKKKATIGVSTAKPVQVLQSNNHPVLIQPQSLPPHQHFQHNHMFLHSQPKTTNPLHTKIQALRQQTKQLQKSLQDYL